MSNKEIAQRIEVSAGTVKIHLSNIFQKLNLSNRTSLAAVALQILRIGPGRPRLISFGPAARRGLAHFFLRRLSSVSAGTPGEGCVS